MIFNGFVSVTPPSKVSNISRIAPARKNRPKKPKIAPRMNCLAYAGQSLTGNILPSAIVS